MSDNLEAEALRRKQLCADRMQSIVQLQVNAMREIQATGFNPGPALKEKMNGLIEAYTAASREYALADQACDIPVFVRPVI